MIATTGSDASPGLGELLVAAAEGSGPRVSVGDLLDRFGDRAFGALIATLAAPNALPVVIPGLSLVVGAPLILLTAQMVAGRAAPWLPRALAARSFARADFLRMALALRSPLARVERLLRPRLSAVTAGPGRRVLGLVGLAMAVALFLPLPFGNTLPGLGLALIGLGMIGRDGAAALVGLVVGLAGFGLAFGAGLGLAIALALAALDMLQ